MRLYNLTDETKTIYQGELITNAEPADVIPEIKTSQYNGTHLPKHVHKLLKKRANTEPSAAEKTQLCDLLRKHEAVFARNDQDLGRTHLVEEHECRTYSYSKSPCTYGFAI